MQPQSHFPMEKSIENLEDSYLCSLKPQAKGYPRTVTFGLPLPQSKLFDLQQFTLFQDKSRLPLHTKITGKWPDGSVRWLRCIAIVSRDDPIQVKVTSSDLASNPKKNLNEQTCWIQGIQLDKNFKASLQFYPLFKISPFVVNQRALEAPELKISLALKLKRHNETSSPVKLEFGKTYVNGLSQKLSVNGEFCQGSHILKFNGNLSFCTETQEIDFDIHLHNPRAAKHPGGHWDLGDPNSIIIEKFSVAFNLGDANHSINVYEDYDKEDTSIPKLEPSPIEIKAPFTLKQYGSSGSNWQSPIHWDEHKQCTVLNPGFQLKTANKEGFIAGRRAYPITQLKSQSNSLYIYLENFWQNFPIKIDSDGELLVYNLFSDQTELQGGESKTWRFKANAFTEEPQQEETLPTNVFEIFEPISIGYDPDYLNSCQVFPHIAFSKTPATLTSLIDQGLVGDQNFFNKREHADVFGWRHYGEIYADHETHGLPEEEKSCFVSHYNNQYDPLMGMTLQYLHRGNSEWLKLIHPLNQHVKDIDIYDTDEDKAEYNGGLFWHTDHYLTAETCSHRSKSRHHTAPYEGFQGGGGPGGQHCYTTGLAMQYWLFGDENAKEKVSQLCHWIRKFYNGDDSILDKTFRLLTVDLKQNTLTNYGVKASGFKYPLDRGTGNYLVALMDHYDLTGCPELLEEIGYVIRNTCHPKEDISLRTLDDTENCWFYTVFFQAVGRFLFLKESLNSIDEDYWYARHSLLHFVNWMYNNESFYLDTPDRLEFPNDTWCAQELRKGNLFYFASYFSEKNSIEFIEKGHTYYDYVLNRLRTSQESQYTRILALMMQNDGVQQRFKDHPKSKIPNKDCDYGKPPEFNRKKIFLSYLKNILKSIFHFSVKREWLWMKLKILK